MPLTEAVAPVSPESLSRFVAQALSAQGVPDDDAAKVAGLMVEADILGFDTHGVFRLRQYLARLQGGGCNSRAQIRVTHETAATAIVDGDNGLGHLAMSANHVSPFGGTDLLLGTNPIAICAPSGGPDPFVLDMATTVAAMGKIKSLAQRGEAMPEGWMVGKDGAPLTDPARRSEGYMLPIGGPKGFGLSVAIGLMAGVLNGAAFGSDVVDFTSDTQSETNTGQFVMALDIAAFGAVDQFTASASRAFDEMRASEPLPGHDPVRLPGEGKGAAVAQRRNTGLDLNPALRRDLEALAQEYNLEAPFQSS